MAGSEQLAGKVLLDVANPLDTSRGMPPTLTVCNDDSLGEQIQRALPDVRVVKTLNTVTAAVMVDPTLVEGAHSIFVAGDDAAAKAQASRAAAGVRLAGRVDRRPRRHHRGARHGDVPGAVAAPLGRRRHADPQRRGALRRHAGRVTSRRS